MVGSHYHRKRPGVRSSRWNARLQLNQIGGNRSANFRNHNRTEFLMRTKNTAKSFYSMSKIQWLYTQSYHQWWIIKIWLDNLLPYSSCPGFHLSTLFIVQSSNAKDYQLILLIDIAVSCWKLQSRRIESQFMKDLERIAQQRMIQRDNWASCFRSSITELVKWMNVSG